MNKICRKCDIEKPVEQFRDNNKTKDKKFPWCMECQNIINRELYVKNKQKRLAQITKWNSENPDKLKTYKSNWRKNKEIIP